MWVIGNVIPRSTLPRRNPQAAARLRLLQAQDRDLTRWRLTSRRSRSAEALGRVSLLRRRQLRTELDRWLPVHLLTPCGGFLFVEQPLARDDLGALHARAVRTRSAPTRATTLSPISRPTSAAGAGGISLKLIKLGGVSAALEAAQRCQRLGLRVNVAAKIAESSIASAAAIHLACAVPAVDWGVSLTHFYLAEDIVTNAPAVTDGGVILPGGPGLGVDVDEADTARMFPGSSKDLDGAWVLNERRLVCHTGGAARVDGETSGSKHEHHNVSVPLHLFARARAR